MAKFLKFDYEAYLTVIVNIINEYNSVQYKEHSKKEVVDAIESLSWNAAVKDHNTMVQNKPLEVDSAALNSVSSVTIEYPDNKDFNTTKDSYELHEIFLHLVIISFLWSGSYSGDDIKKGQEIGSVKWNSYRTARWFPISNFRAIKVTLAKFIPLIYKDIAYITFNIVESISVVKKLYPELFTEVEQNNIPLSFDTNRNYSTKLVDTHFDHEVTPHDSTIEIPF